MACLQEGSLLPEPPTSPPCAPAHLSRAGFSNGLLAPAVRLATLVSRHAACYRSPYTGRCRPASPRAVGRRGTTMRWVTRERPKIDRIACPWLVARFVDPDPEFLYVPADRVLAVAGGDRGGPLRRPGRRAGPRRPLVQLRRLLGQVPARRSRPAADRGHRAGCGHLAP